MNEEFKAGDVVQLKSGGPKMTVSKVAHRNGATMADCDWFEGNTATYGSFPVSSLKVVEQTESAAAVRVGKPGAWS